MSQNLVDLPKIMCYNLCKQSGNYRMQRGKQGPLRTIRKFCSLIAARKVPSLGKIVAYNRFAVSRTLQSIYNSDEIIL